MSHLPSSSVRDHMKWVCFDNTKVVTNSFTCSLVSLRMLSLMNSLADAATVVTTVLAVVHFKLQLILCDLIQFVKCCVFFFFFFLFSPFPSSSSFLMQAGLLGCEAVLSSMALMQASTMAAPPKKMMAPLGHAPPQRDGPDRAPQSHMILPSGMSCPPLLIRKEGEFQAPRLLDEKDMRTNEDMQQKKKNRKSVTPCKVREQEGRGGKGTGGDENGPASKVQKNFICDHCYGAFRSGYHLKRHILIHTGEKPYACAVCDMRFIQRYHLERHSLIHTGVKPFACSMCDMRFFQRYHLERHRLTHTGVKPYACSMCDMRFFQRYHLARHTLTHTGVKPYACSMCDMRFFQRYHLARHTLTHTGVKPYACSMCDMRFFQRYHLARHTLTHTGMIN
uniref:Zinc finger protein 740a n=1 Tax=Poecilia latipinna TaxID=48699 RepID=A0A3B3VTJ8_9TELE